jgi:hypothetical protein
MAGQAASPPHSDRDEAVEGILELLQGTEDASLEGAAWKGARTEADALLC